MNGRKPAHVVHVIAGLGLGGAERSLINLVNHDRPDRPRQSVINLLGGESFEATIQQKAAALHTIGMERPHQVLSGIRRLTRLLRELQPDAIQSWMYNADLMTYWAWRRARLRGTRLYWGVRCSDMDLSQYSRRLRWTVTACAKRSGNVTGIVANSHAGKSVHQHLGYRSPLFEVIENGIDINTFRLMPESRQQRRDEFGVTAERPMALHVARVDPMKDHALLQAVARQRPDIDFVAIGTGTAGLDGPANLKGVGPRSDLPQCYAAADVAILTSAYGEGFPNVLGEAMACGLPVVTTDVGDAAHIVGDTGRIVPPRDAAAFSAALDDVLTDPARLADPRSRIVQRFTLDRAVARFDALHATGAVPKETHAPTMASA